MKLNVAACPLFQHDRPVCMQRSHKTILAGLFFFTATCIVAVAGYVIAGWDWIDAVYMVVITVYGVGYGEVQPIAHSGLKFFTMLVILCGCTSAIYVFGGFVQFLVEGELNQFLGARRMKSEVSRLQDHIILCGFGRVGKILSRELHAHQQAFVVIDADPTKIEVAGSLGYLALKGNATTEEILMEAGIDRAMALGAVLSDDVLNVFVTLTARELRPDLAVFARAENPATEKKLLTSGAQQVVLPASIGARRIAESMLDFSRAKQHPERAGERRMTMSDLERLGFVHQSCRLPDRWVGGTVQDVERQLSGQFLICELRRSDGETLPRPGSQESLKAGDQLFVLGPADLQQQMERLACPTTGFIYRGARQ